MFNKLIQMAHINWYGMLDMSLITSSKITTIMKNIVVNGIYDYDHKMTQSKYNTFGLTIKSCSHKWHSLQM
jgi:hypothetical protein